MRRHRYKLSAMSPLPSPFQALLSACLDPETLTAEDLSLWQALDEHARLGGEELDLSAHREAVLRVPEALMEAFADACRASRRRLKVLRLPAGLAVMPRWVGAFAWAEHLTGPGLRDTAAPAPVSLAA